MIKDYAQFITENLSNKQNYYVDLIINYIRKNADYNLFPYDEEFDIKKSGDNKILTGKLFLTDKSKAIRFNFDKTRLDSVDMWLDFKFTNDKIHDKPTYTMYVPVGSVVQLLDDFVAFIDGEFDVLEKKSKEDEEKPKVKKAPAEDVQLKTLKISSKIMSENMDVFDALTFYTNQVAFGISNALVISGGAGLGKTSEVTNTLKDSRQKFISFKGDITTAALYETLFLNRNELIVFDDMDSVFDTLASVNILKAALDTYKEREISRIIKTHFNSKGMSDIEIQAEYERTGKLPNQFMYKGRIIFITNVNGKDIDPAIISRSLHVDIDLNRKEVMERMRKIMTNLFPKIPMQLKEETLEFLDFITTRFDSKFPLNIRSLIHSINIRVSNDLKMNIGGEEVPVWQMLIKQYLVGKKDSDDE